MGAFVAGKVVKLIIRNNGVVNQARVLVLGMTFKENCPDIRNSRVIDILTELHEFGVQTDVYDPLADAHEVADEYGIHLLPALPAAPAYNAIILAVAHEHFLTAAAQDWLTQQAAPVYDVKSCLPAHLVHERL